MNDSFLLKMISTPMEASSVAETMAHPSGVDGGAAWAHFSIGKSSNTQLPWGLGRKEPALQPSDEEEQAIDEGEWESLKFKLETTEQGGKLDVQMTLTNEGSEDMTLTFSSGQRFEIILLDQNQAEVYRYSADKMFTMALEQEELKAGQDISF